ncbi:hypothetical protein CFC21_072979 [Triticum aestivum]|uniref:Knottin scorpion toxin-like domain-containing protein n=2 Tax=Triticum aestivum TaxID=4565 RepID=A0A3B6LRI6_WHEAT|nr:hypothetical protein CFC21_072979 [Triticum aestivum]
MEGRSALCFLVVLTLLAASPALAAERCEEEHFFSLICMDWLCAQECASQNPDMRVNAAYCTAKGVKRYCHCTMCYK